MASLAAVGWLNCRVFKNHALTMKTKTIVFRAVILSTLLYPCEAWTLDRRQIKRPEQFQQRMLRPILGIQSIDRITNKEVLSSAGLPIDEATVHWVGHVQRMDSSRLSKTLLYGDLVSEKRYLDRSKLRYKDQLKSTQARVSIYGREYVTRDRKA